MRSMSHKAILFFGFAIGTTISSRNIWYFIFKKSFGQLKWFSITFITFGGEFQKLTWFEYGCWRSGWSALDQEALMQSEVLVLSKSRSLVVLRPNIRLSFSYYYILTKLYIQQGVTWWYMYNWTSTLYNNNNVFRPVFSYCGQSSRDQPCARSRSMFILSCESIP